MQILINRGGGIGDVLMLTAVCRALKDKNPDAEIWFKTRHPAALENNPDIHRIVRHDFESLPKFNLRCDFNGSVEPRAILVDGKVSLEQYNSVPRIDLLFKRAGLPIPAQPELVYRATDDERKQAAARFVHVDRPNIVFAINSSSPIRTYPVELACHTMSQLAKKYHVTITGDVTRLWGHTHPFTLHFRKWLAQQQGNRILNLVDQTTFREAAAIVDAADLLICSDTGILHLAAALQKPCVALFGNIDPYLRCSHYPTVTPLVRKIGCSFCGDVITKACPSYVAVHQKQQVGADCMRAIPPVEIVEAVDRVLAFPTTIYKDRHEQACPHCNLPLTTETDHFGGGSHYWVLRCQPCGLQFHYDTYRFKLEPASK